MHIKICTVNTLSINSKKFKVVFKTKAKNHHVDKISSIEHTDILMQW
jgi:hypothetical protein